MTNGWRPERRTHTREPGHGGREPRREPVQGICLHYDGSGSDAGAEAWFDHPDAKFVGYNHLVLDDGLIVDFDLYDLRTYHAGACRPSSMRFDYRDANSALVGVAIAATAGEQATWKQELGVATQCLEIFRHERWAVVDDELLRITGHQDEVWPRGRKWDPVGHDPNRPVLYVPRIRNLVAFLDGTGGS